MVAAEHIREAVRQERLEIEGHAVPLTVSIGVAAMRPDDGVVEDVVRRADAALYDAKRAGKDRVAQATDDGLVGTTPVAAPRAAAQPASGARSMAVVASDAPVGVSTYGAAETGGLVRR